MKINNLIIRTASQIAGILPQGIKRLIYRVPFLAGLIRKTLNASAPIELTEVRIASGPAKDLKMVLDLQSEKDYWLGTYEVDLQGAAERFIIPGSTIYDVGANIGYVSLLCANLAGVSGHVHSFEALPANIDRLRHNININNLSNRVLINHSAVTNRNGPVTFFTHSSGAMGKAQGSAGRDEDYGESITVNGITLDHYFQSMNVPPPDLIKMDIEGGEGNALKGSEKLLASIRPALLIELHGELAAEQVWEILSKHEYEIFSLRRGYPRIERLDSLDWKAYIAATHTSKTAWLT